MRTPYLFVGLAIAACSVPDKTPFGGDGGTGDGSGLSGSLETTITEAPHEFSSESVARFKFKSNVASAAFECSVDGGAVVTCTSPFSRNLGDGAHSFSVRATNNQGIEDATPAEHLWSIDTGAPNTTLVTTPPDSDNSATVRFEFKSNEQNVVFECSIDSGAFAACKSGDPFGPLADGAHTFSVRAKDRAGNVDASPAVHAWAVDTSTPDTTLLSGPSGPTADMNATFAFTSNSGPSATFQCSLDSAPFVDCASPATYNNLAMTTHTFAVRVRDANGNVDPTPATRAWYVDLTPPETTIDAGPSGAVSLASAMFSFTANEDSVFACSLDNAPFAACTSPASYPSLAQGAHTFAVRATDLAGNVETTPATAAWTIDTVAPDLQIISGPMTGSVVGPRIVFAFTASEGTIECRLESTGPWMPCASPFGYNEAAGPGTFDVRATDGAGNSTSVNRTFTIACAAPDPNGALGLLHLDDTGQPLANATGGAGATLGLFDTPELADPSSVPGRFATGLAFDAGQGDIVAWALGGGASTSNLTIELWARPNALSGSRDILANGDESVVIRVRRMGNDRIRFIATIGDSSGGSTSVSSDNVPAEMWHHVLVSVSPPSLRLWVDGDRTEENDVALSGSPSLDWIRLGGGLVNAFGGTLDEVYIAPTSIPDDETALGRFCPVSGISL